MTIWIRKLVMVLKVYEAEVVIIGGGAVGLGTAYQLSRNGFKNIWILEQEPYLGGKSTLKCAGGFRHQFSSKVNVEMSILSYEILNNLSRERGSFFNNCGYMFALTEEDTMQEYADSVLLQNSLGVESKWISTTEVKKLLPIINTDTIKAATYYEKDGLIDVGAIISFYIKELQEKQINLKTNSKVKNIYVCSSGIKYVETESMKIKTNIIINGAGAEAGNINEMFTTQLPVKSMKQQLFVTSDFSQYQATYPVVIYPTTGLGFHKEGQGILSGLHMENPDQLKNVNRKWELKHCKELVQALDGIENTSILTRWTGYYDMTPDLNPIIGEDPDINGIFNAFGFSGHGLMHSAAASVLLCRMILKQDLPIDIEALSSRRFYKDILNKKEIFKI